MNDVMRENSPLRLGVICSTNGGVFRAIDQVTSAWPLAECEWYVVTDRACGIEGYCEERQIEFRRFANTSRQKFAADAATWLSDHGRVEAGLLFFDRLVSEELFSQIPLINVHPSLLPAFPGMNSVVRAVESGARFLGATAHLVDAGVDTGPIIVQACDPVSPTWSMGRIYKQSFLQKTLVTLVVIELLLAGQLSFAVDNTCFQCQAAWKPAANCNPDLQDPLLSNVFHEFCDFELKRVAA